MIIFDKNIENKYYWGNKKKRVEKKARGGVKGTRKKRTPTQQRNWNFYKRNVFKNIERHKNKEIRKP